MIMHTLFSWAGAARPRDQAHSACDPDARPRRAGASGSGSAVAMFPMLIHLRYLAVVGQIATVLFVGLRLGLGIPMAQMFAVSAGLLAFNAVAHACWRSTRSAGPRMLMLQLLVDMLALTALLYLAGGPGNPFVSLYLLPVAIAAVGLELAPMLAMTVLSAVFYTALMRWHVPLPTIHGRDFELHVIGMWINFLLSVTIMAAVLGRFMAVIQAQRRALTLSRERALRDESMLALGTLAAGTAHELNTPLTTIGLLVDDWAVGTDAPDAVDFALMRAQLAHCRGHVRTLAEIARRSEMDQPVQTCADTFVLDCVERWKLLRPSVAVTLDTACGDDRLWVDATLPQALINLFNNAADANASTGAEPTVDIAMTVRGTYLHLRIADRGPGPGAIGLRDAAGAERSGLGLGLMISNASIERAQGQVRQYARDGGGCVTEVELPLIGAHA